MNKNFLYLSLEENLLVFDVFEYFGFLMKELHNYFYDWSILTDEMVKGKDKIIKSFINRELCALVDRMKEDKSYSIMCFLNKEEFSEDWYRYYEKPEKLFSMFKRLFKKQFKIIETTNKKINFKIGRAHV